MVGPDRYTKVELIPMYILRQATREEHNAFVLANAEPHSRVPAPIGTYFYEVSTD
jgi:hypothetical protein